MVKDMMDGVGKDDASKATQKDEEAAAPEDNGEHEWILFDDDDAVFISREDFAKKMYPEFASNQTPYILFYSKVPATS
jgi:hypothetical protein